MAGIYEFFAFVRARPRGSLRFFIDGALYASPYEYYGEEVTQGEGGTMTVNLQAGQVVDVRTGNANYTVVGDGGSSWFGGQLLFPNSA